MSNHSEMPWDKEIRVDAPFKGLLLQKLGATGNFPNGKLTQQDEGEIRIAIGEKDGTVVIDFGKPTAWIGFEPEQALQIAELLKVRAYNIMMQKQK